MMHGSVRLLNTGKSGSYLHFVVRGRIKVYVVETRLSTVGGVCGCDTMQWIVVAGYICHSKIGNQTVVRFNTSSRDSPIGYGFAISCALPFSLDVLATRPLELACKLLPHDGDGCACATVCIGFAFALELSSS
jgi:hypothetical protein